MNYTDLKAEECRNSEEGEFWKTLTEEQKREVYQSYDESNDDDNQVSWHEVKEALRTRGNWMEYCS